MSLYRPKEPQRRLPQEVEDVINEGIPFKEYEWTLRTWQVSCWPVVVLISTHQTDGSIKWFRYQSIWIINSFWWHEEDTFACHWIVVSSEILSTTLPFSLSLKFVIGKDGICGLVCEHTASEGITVLRFLEEFLSKNPCKGEPTIGIQRQNSEGTSKTVLGKRLSGDRIGRFQHKVIPLGFDADETIQKSLPDSIRKINRFVTFLQSTVQLINPFLSSRLSCTLRFVTLTHRFVPVTDWSMT